MLLHLPIVILTTLSPVAVADTAPTFDIVRECRFEGGSAANVDQCARDEVQALRQLKAEWTRFAGADKSSCTAVSHEPARQSAERLALVIGNSGYPDADAPLSQMASDAEALANVLRKDGFVVNVVEDATHAEMTRAIDRLKLRVGPGSIVLLYFGGYGVQSHGQNYMIPVDAKIWGERDVRRDGVSVDRLLSEFEGSGARIRLAVIDASRRNPYERRFRSYSHGLASIQATANTLVLTSAAPDQVVGDRSPQRHDDCAS